MHIPTSTQLRSRQELWWAARLRCLLKCVSELDQSWFAPGATDERDSHRQTEDVACGHRDVRISRYRRSRRIAAREVIAVDPVGRPAGTAGRRNQRIEFVLVHH